MCRVHDQLKRVTTRPVIWKGDGLSVFGGRPVPIAAGGKPPDRRVCVGTGTQVWKVP